MQNCKNFISYALLLRKLLEDRLPPPPPPPKEGVSLKESGDDKGGASNRRTGLKKKANIFLNTVLHTFAVTTEKILWSRGLQLELKSAGGLVETVHASWAVTIVCTSFGELPRLMRVKMGRLQAVVPAAERRGVGEGPWSMGAGKQPPTAVNEVFLAHSPAYLLACLCWPLSHNKGRLSLGVFGWGRGEGP